MMQGLVQGYVAIFLILHGATLLVSKLQSTRAAIVYPISASLVLVSSYFWVIIGGLSSLPYALGTLSLIGYSLHIVSRTHSSSADDFAFNSAWTIIFIMALSYLAARGADFFAWDEYSHWGAQVEYLKSFQSLHMDGKYLLFPEYIPGASIWRMLPATLGISDRSAYYFSGWLLAFSALVSAVNRHDLIKGALSASCLFFIWIFFFQSLVLTLYVDHLQALLIYVAMLLCVQRESHRGKGGLGIGLVLGAIVALKHVGAIFAAFIIGWYLINAFFIRGHFKKALFHSLLISIIPLLVFSTWKLYVEKYMLQRDIFTKPLGLGGVWAQLLDNITKILNSKFPHANFFQPEPIIDMAMTGFNLLFLICLSVPLLLAFFLKQRSKYAGAIYLCSCLVVYLVFLAYIRARTPWGGDPYSFTRYYCVLLCPLVLLALSRLLDRKAVRLQILAVGTSFTLASQVAVPVNSIFPSASRSSALLNAEMVGVVNKLKMAAGTRLTSAWYITTQEDSLRYFVFRMYAMPYYVLDYSAGWGVIEKDPSLPNGWFDENAMAKRMCLVDYIVIGKAPNAFWGRYRSLFDQTTAGVYEVDKARQGRCYAKLKEVIN
ncbi:hypothetical protein N8I74_00555 [Chitiniphilus purpureus]|uniref:Glycosyltransferase RgtA/B/C/D-like domain-containing protein n=1 Tax=Chitiniphilus purpureus TaxID=2981137 RepID=A0ABY6DMG4_9NEIS|nr:hypothetical protein [Chitiniphilus sp. CD1]UXY15541.1 hypothetical protein N8I74_00555 [Chitiniphilus sp. CD1]